MEFIVSRIDSMGTGGGGGETIPSHVPASRRSAGIKSKLKKTTKQHVLILKNRMSETIILVWRVKEIWSA
jgi:hypothetical protein